MIFILICWPAAWLCIPLSEHCLLIWDCTRHHIKSVFIFRSSKSFTFCMRASMAFACLYDQGRCNTSGLGACLLPQVVIAGATRAFQPHDEHIIQEYELALDGMRLSPGSKYAGCLSCAQPMCQTRCISRQEQGCGEGAADCAQGAQGAGPFAADRQHSALALAPPQGTAIVHSCFHTQVIKACCIAKQLWML